MSSKPEHQFEQRLTLWQEFLEKQIKKIFSKTLYVLLECKQLVGLFHCIFVKKSLAEAVRNVDISLVKTGLKGYHGNKV